MNISNVPHDMTACNDIYVLLPHWFEHHVNDVAFKRHHH